MNDNTFHNNDFDQLREQMSILKQKLNQQEIVNERLLRKSMSSRFSWIKNYVWGQIILVPFLLIILFFGHKAMGLSWWLYAFMAVMLVGDVTVDYWINRIPKAELMNNDLLQVGEHLARMKRYRAIAFCIAILMVIIWVIWLVLELLRVSQTAEPQSFLQGVASGGLIGAVIGGVIGLGIAILVFRKMQKTNDDIIDQIDALRQE